MKEADDAEGSAGEASEAASNDEGDGDESQSKLPEVRHETTQISNTQ